MGNDKQSNTPTGLLLLTIGALLAPACTVDTMSDEEVEETIAAYAANPRAGMMLVRLKPTGRNGERAGGFALVLDRPDRDRLELLAWMHGLKPNQAYDWDVHKVNNCGNRGGAAGPVLVTRGVEAKLPRLRTNSGGIAYMRLRPLHKSITMNRLRNRAFIVHGKKDKNNGSRGDDGQGNGDGDGGGDSEGGSDGTSGSNSDGGGDSGDNGNGGGNGGGDSGDGGNGSGEGGGNGGGNGGGEGTGGGTGSGAGDGGGGGPRISCGVVQEPPFDTQ